MRLAEFLSVQLGAEESSGSPPDLTKVSGAEGPSPADPSSLHSPLVSPCVSQPQSPLVWFLCPFQPSDVPPLLTVTGQLLALLAWIRSPRGRQALSQGTQPALEGQCPTPVGASGVVRCRGCVWRE